MLAAWLWVRKYWQLLVGLLLAGLGLFFGLTLRKKTVIVSGEDPEKKAIEEKTREAEKKLDDQAVVAKEEAVKVHDKEVSVVVEREKKVTEVIKDDVDQTNDYLKNVGDEVRKDSR